MENNNLNNQEAQSDENNPLLNDDATFENPSVDPGFESSEEESSDQMEGREDKRTGNIDADKSIKEMREEFDQEQDAMNNEEGDGSYDPTKI
jgi:recombination DNA repair RAD52 pathway protein